VTAGGGRALPTRRLRSSNPRSISFRHAGLVPGIHDFFTAEAIPMATMNLLLLPGDGIGPEVMAEVNKLIAWMNAHGMGTFATEEGLVGGSAFDAHGVSVTDEVVEKAKAADAVTASAIRNRTKNFFPDMGEEYKNKWSKCTADTAAHTDNHRKSEVES